MLSSFFNIFYKSNAFYVYGYIWHFHFHFFLFTTATVVKAFITYVQLLPPSVL